MLDVGNLVQATITNMTNGNPTYWTETNPTLTDIKFTQDEFDGRSPALQVLFENFPEKKIWVHDSVYRVEHRCRITLFLKPMRYAETDIATYKTRFKNTKTEIDRILGVVKYSISGITNLELSNNGWNDKNSIRVGRGTKDMGTFMQNIGGQDINIIFRSETTVTAIYYIGVA